MNLLFNYLRVETHQFNNYTNAYNLKFKIDSFLFSMYVICVKKKKKL